ncbi:MAG: GIY-YIG nuclease family protein [bacterium]|nr:GIY-YIG nuclease family protein [bacterium]
MFYVYVLKSSQDSSLYIGYTRDLKRRFAEHNNKKNISTKSKAPFELVYYESYRSQRDAKRRESMLKKFSGAYTQLKRRITDSVA